MIGIGFVLELPSPLVGMTFLGTLEVVNDFGKLVGSFSVVTAKEFDRGGDDCLCDEDVKSSDVNTVEEG